MAAAAAAAALVGFTAGLAAGLAAGAAALALVALAAQQRASRREEETRALMAAIVESTEDAVVVTGMDGVITAWNAAAQRMYGYPAGEAIGRPVSILFPSGREDESSTLERIRRGEPIGHHHSERLTREGSVIQVSVTISPVRCAEGRLVGISRIARDITEQKRAEHEFALASAEARRTGDALREALERLDFHLANSPLAALEWDGAFRFVRWSAAAERIFGWTAAETLGRTPDDLRLVHEEDAPAVAAIMRDMVSGVSPSTFKANRNRRKDGTVIHCEWYNSALHDEAGRIVSVLSLGLDVTARVRAQEALAHSEERLDIAQRAGGIGVYDWDLRAGSVVWSEQMEALFGLAPGTFEGRFEHWARRIERNDLRRITAVLRAVSRGKEAEVLTEYRAILPDGEQRWHSGRGRLFYDGRGRPVRIVGSITDITSRRRTEEKLRHTDKLESLANLAGGVAHDFNNLLVNIIGYAGLLLEDAPQGSQMREYCEAILGAGERASHLTRQMLAYSGKGKFVVKCLDVSREIRELAGLVQSAIPRHVRLEFDLADGLPAVEADAGQIQQLVLNLVVNAAEAMSEAGAVAVSTALRDIDKPFLEQAIADENTSPGRYVQIQVRDTGHGMDPATQARIFDPFFTTKFVGRGLGLAAVLGIVRGHKGAIEVISAPGQGTTFRALLPVAAGTAGTVLVIAAAGELGSVRKALQKHGYEIVAVEDARQAVKVFGTIAPRVSLVLFGFGAAEPSIADAVRRVREIRPDVRIDFLSPACTGAKGEAPLAS